MTKTRTPATPDQELTFEGYSFPLKLPVQFAAIAMEAPSGASIDEMVAGYSHPNPADIGRLRRHNKIASDAEAFGPRPIA